MVTQNGPWGSGFNFYPGYHAGAADTDFCSTWVCSCRFSFRRSGIDLPDSTGGLLVRVSFRRSGVDLPDSTGGLLMRVPFRRSGVDLPDSTGGLLMRVPFRRSGSDLPDSILGVSSAVLLPHSWQLPVPFETQRIRFNRRPPVLLKCSRKARTSLSAVFLAGETPYRLVPAPMLILPCVTINSSHSEQIIYFSPL